MCNNQNIKAGRGKQNRLLLYCSLTEHITGFDLKVGCFKLLLYILTIIRYNPQNHEKAKVKDKEQIGKSRGEKGLRRWLSH